MLVPTSQMGQRMQFAQLKRRDFITLLGGVPRARQRWSRSADVPSRMHVCRARRASITHRRAKKSLASLRSSASQTCTSTLLNGVSMSVIDRGALDALSTRPYCASAKKQDLLVKSLCELVHKRIGAPKIMDLTRG
jgi:hypothetical protein